MLTIDGVDKSLDSVMFFIEQISKIDEVIYDSVFNAMTNALSDLNIDCNCSSNCTSNDPQSSIIGLNLSPISICNDNNTSNLELNTDDLEALQNRLLDIAQTHEDKLKALEICLCILEDLSHYFFEAKLMFNGNNIKNYLITHHKWFIAQNGIKRCNLKYYHRWRR